MFKKILVILAMVGLMIPVLAFAAFGLEGAAEGTGLIKPQGSAQEAIPNLIGNVVAVVLSFVGVIFFLLILYAGFLWMTAFGSSEKVDRAKDIVQHAAVGLLIVLAAYAISKFIFSSLTSATAATPAPTGFDQCSQAKTQADCVAVKTGGPNPCNWDPADNTCF
ncbi:MAG: Uncharacterized protein G01um101413_945 [Parcubacteria group bacterium Gr01-1014_13]|nr:MAG: Uncharacterized protein G01um101413_945 [Parcubacteria group bacterium Gr01-1014_13]